MLFLRWSALSVTCGDTSPKGRGKNFPATPLALPLGELDAKRPERARIANGAQPTDTVRVLLKKSNVL